MVRSSKKRSLRSDKQNRLAQLNRNRARKLFVEPLEDRRVLATLVVTTYEDVLDDSDGLCSLREAVINANDDAATYATCGAGSGADTIDVTMPGTYTLSIAGNVEDFAETGDLDILDDLTIVGAGAGSSIVDAGNFDGDPGTGNEDRVFHIPLGDAFSVIFEDVTIRGGLATDDFTELFAPAGGGLLNDNGIDVTIERSVITNNRADGTDLGFDAFGGGVYSEDASWELLPTLSLLSPINYSH